MRIVLIVLYAVVLASSMVRGQEATSAPGAVPPGGSREIVPADPDLAGRPFSRLFAEPEDGEPPRGGTDNAADAPAAGGGTSAGGGSSISSNPAAVNIASGTGALGRFLGFSEESGIRVGGVWIGDASGVLSGGRSPGRWGLNSLTIAGIGLDLEKRYGWKGASFGTEFLQFNGQPTNVLAGAFPGFDSLEGAPPLVRNELYQLWYRQSCFDDRLIVRVGKTVPTFDFNNVVKPVPVGDPTAAIPAVTGLIYTPVFVNPTLLGVIPGYYNSATGITTTLAPTKSTYVNYGVYDGNIVRGRQLGLEGPHFNGYYFHIGEVGASYFLGAQRKPGSFGVGVWGQTGRLSTNNGGTGNGAIGTYLFGSQRLWFRNPGADSSGVSGFYQFGANNSNALLARYYIGGGLTAFGLVPGRPDDSFGCGLAWTALTRADQAGNLFSDNPNAITELATNHPTNARLNSNQLMLAAYYQMKIAKSAYFQTTLTDIPNPGMSASIPNALALTFRVIVLF